MNSTIKTLIPLLLLGGGEIVNGDVTFSSAENTAAKQLTFSWKSSAATDWFLGGARFTADKKPAGFPVTNWALNATGKPNEYTLIFGDASSITTTTPIAAGGSTGVSTLSDYSGQALAKLSNPELLLKTGESGVVEQPKDEKPITLDQIDSLLNLPNYHKSDFRYVDTLGANGGIYSGGILDTWLGQTQVQIAMNGKKFGPIHLTEYPTFSFNPKQTLFWMTVAMGQEYFQIDLQWMLGKGMQETGLAIGTGLVTSGLGVWQIEPPTGKDRGGMYPQLFQKGNIAQCWDGTSNPSGDSAAIVSNYLYSISCDRAAYDLYNYSKGICWKDICTDSKDPYFPLGTIMQAYNGGLGNAQKSAQEFMMTSVYNPSTPHTSLEKWCSTPGYIGGVLKGTQNLEQASKEAFTDLSIPLVDMPLTLKDLQRFFYGEGGTASVPGRWGLFAHFKIKDPAAFDKTLVAAFDKLKGKAPGMGADQISYRYNWLTILRVLKSNFLVTWPRPNALGEWANAVKTLSPAGAKDCNGRATDLIYPYAEISAGPDYDDVAFTLTVKGTDETEIEKVKWCINSDWAQWSEAPLASGTQTTTVKTFTITVPKKQITDLYGDNTGTLWFMVTDASGNSVVKSVVIKGNPLKYAAAIDKNGDGKTDSIRVSIVEGALDPKAGDIAADPTAFQYAWPAKTPLGNATKTYANAMFLIDPVSDSGAGLGKVTITYPSIGLKERDIIDSVGPAAQFASLSVENKARPNDSFKLVISEKIKLLDKTDFAYLKFYDIETKSEKAIASQKVIMQGDTTIFVFATDEISAQDSVKLIFDSGIFDEVDNRPAPNTIYVKLNAIGGREPLFKSAAVYDKNGDGLADSGSVAVTLGGATNKFVIGDASSKQESWPTDNALTNMASFKTVGDERATFVPANTSGSGKGKVELKFDNGKFVVPGDLIDSVGPVILKAPTPTYTLPVSGAADQNYHFELTFSEKVAALSDGKTYFEFAADTTTAGTQKATTTAANKSGNSYDFTFDSDALKGFRFVRIIPKGELEDAAKISAQTNNQWVEFTRKDPNTTPSMVNAAVSYQGSTKATGKGDRLTIRFKLASGDEKLIGTDLEKVEWNWDGSSGNAIKGKFGVQTSNDTVTISVPDLDLSGKGIGNGSLTFIKNGKTEMVPFGAIIDSVGPAILDATCYRGQNGSSRDTLELTLSEPITSGTSGDYLFRYAGKEFGPKNVLAITNLNGTSVTYRMETATNEIRANDWINLADKGISDAVNNAPNPLNQKVPVTIRGSKVPAITAAAMFDKDGDGTADSIKIDLLLGSDQDRFVASNQTKSEYSWPSTSPLTSTSDVTVLDDTTIVLKGMNIAETFGAGLVKLSFPENGSVEEKLIDKVGPVLTKARLYERTDSGDDTLLVEFSEDVKNLADAKRLLNINNSDVASKTAVSKSGKLWILTFENSHNIRVGQMANIVASSEIRDQNENPAHGNNRKIAIELLKRAVNVVESESGYFDTNPNGTVDLLTVKLAKGVAKERAAEFKATVKWPSKTGLSSIADLALTATISGDTSDLIHFTIDENAVMNGMTYVDAATFGEVQLTQPDDLLGEVTTTFTGKDFMAPVLINTAEYRGIELTENLPEFKDTLKLTFSETIKPFSPEMIETKIFNLKFRKNGGLGSVKLVNNCTFDGATLVAPVLVKSDSKEIPAPGDSIQIAGDLTIADNQGNKQDTLTPFVPFALVHLPVKYELTVYPQPFTVKTDNRNELLELYEIEGAGKLAIMVRPFGDRAGETLSGTITLFDAVGNQVVSNEEMLFQKGALVYVSDGTNQKGRALGTGVYHGVIVTTSKSGDSVQKNEIVVRVGIKSQAR